MSWAEVKKVNADFATSLDLWFKMNDIAIYGLQSNVLKNEDSMKNLANNVHSINHLIVNPFLLDYVCTHGLHIGEFFGKIYTLGEHDWKSLDTLDSLLNDTTAISMIINDEIAMNAIVNSTKFMESFVKNNTDMEILTKNIFAIIQLMKSDYNFPIEFNSYRTNILETISTSDMFEKSNTHFTPMTQNTMDKNKAIIFPIKWSSQSGSRVTVYSSPKSDYEAVFLNATSAFDNRLIDEGICFRGYTTSSNYGASYNVYIDIYTLKE